MNTIPATIEAVERLATKIIKLKKSHADKMLSLAGPENPEAKTQPARMQSRPAATFAPVVIDTPPALLPKIEQPTKPLVPLKIEQTTEQQQMASPEFFNKSKRQLIDAYLGDSKYSLEVLLEKINAIINDKSNIYSEFAGRVLENFNDWIDYRKYKNLDTPPALLPKIEQPTKPLATTCNPDALRFRSKATICRAVNRPT
jgi:hypothetical protein